MLLQALLQMFHLLQTCVVEVLHVATLAGAGSECMLKTVPTGATVPTCEASEAGVGGPHLHAHQQARDGH